jgi:hypothetical protein
VNKKDNPKNHSFSHFGKECANQKKTYQDKKIIVVPWPL